ncbi:non-functional NADPH-dependent codeinone reductase 2-like [Phoenix dactylifera]|uniref:Non-functional NADPH-dependent codeinone reductase 2-like n=1 Tax=Phoenix dactylifera TaxID=42345 RepID=A0A8B9AEM0_PHODC|nr:non-functional NADPH-dependent codeinone reductase 2-like [Phoenix dactylifera]
MLRVPEVALSSGGSRPIPMVGMGTAGRPVVPENVTLAVLQAIELGYRHFDTSSLYQTERPLGEAIAGALRRGLVKSRSELFVTSKLWCSDSHRDLVLPALHRSLRNLQLDYLDLYLIHWPMSLKPGACSFPINKEDILPLDLMSVWQAMEECQKLGLAKSIGVSNFSRKKLEELLAFAKMPPAVNQVEMNPLWQQKKLREFCKEKGIHITACSPIGGQDRPGSRNLVMESKVLQEIAKTRGKTVPQVSLRWVYEQGASLAVKSFNKERLAENISIFDWELSDEEHQEISQISQCKKYSVQTLLSHDGSGKLLGLSDFDVLDE